jgi:MinD-like ATPase involved in chromosome partitioning or flagellar assembly
MEGRGHSGYAGTVPELLDAMARGGIAAAAMMNLTPVRDMREALLARLPAPLGPAQRAEEEARIAEEFGIPLLAQIPLDPETRVGGDEGTPITVRRPRSPQAAAFRRLAEAVIARVGSVSRPLPTIS